MNNFCYSVVIRTTGQAGEKYARLLSCISKLQPCPEEIIVVLPDGVKPPQEQLGCETFYHCPKGMVRQRLYGLGQCRSPYALFCDDDIAFSPDFVQKLHRPLENGIAELSAGPLLSFFPQKGGRAILSMVLGNTAPMLPWRNMYVRVLRSTGYSYNRNIDPAKCLYYPAESLAWTCFYAKTEAMRRIHLEEETWLDAHGYAAMDDQTMFYKAHLRGIRTVVVADAPYEHLDAKTSRKFPQSRPNVNYSIGFNRVVFWHRFLFSIHRGGFERLMDRVCFYYQCFCGYIYSKLNVFRGKKEKSDHQRFVSGMLDGARYVKSQEYENLSPVKE